MAVFAEGVGGRRWDEVVERNERVGQSACALAWEKPDGLASGGRERETVKMGKVERRRVWMGKENTHFIEATCKTAYMHIYLH